MKTEIQDRKENDIKLHGKPIRPKTILWNIETNETEKAIQYNGHKRQE